MCDYKSGCKSLFQVIGIVTAGFGLSSTVFSPLQTLLINPSNLPPLKAGKEIGNIAKLWIIPGRWPVQLHFSLLQTGGGAQPSVLPSSMFSRFWPTFPPPFSTYQLSTRPCSLWVRRHQSDDISRWRVCYQRGYTPSGLFSFRFSFVC